MKSLVLCLLFGAFMTGCAPSPSASEENVVGGKAIDSSQFPAVVPIGVTENDNCTGTFINSSVVLTAAHCVPDFTVYKGHYPIKIYRHKQHQVNGKMSPPHDLAVLVYEKALAPAVTKLASQKPAVGETMNMIGFGCDNVKDWGNKNQKRLGVNTIHSFGGPNDKVGEIPVQGTIKSLRNPNKNSSSNAGLCRGDSGGPALNRKGEIIGVASMIHLPVGSHFNFHVDVTSAVARTFFAQVAGKGVAIPGINPVSDSSVLEELTDEKPVSDKVSLMTNQLLQGSFAEFKAGVLKAPGTEKKILLVPTTLKIQVPLSEKLSWTLKETFTGELSGLVFNDEALSAAELVPYSMLAQVNPQLAQQLQASTTMEQSIKLITEAGFTAVLSSLTQTGEANFRQLPERLKLEAQAYFPGGGSLVFHP